MEMQNLMGYPVAFLCGALACYLLHRLLHFIKNNERRGDPSTINPDVIKQMVDLYRDNQLNAINKILGISDANSVSFDLRTLKKFVSDIECYTKKLDSRISDQALGVRFYYAAYPKEDDWSSFENEKLIGKNYAQKHTLIMIPTLKKKSSDGSYLDYDFNPLDRRTFFPTSAGRNDQPVMLMAMSSDSSDDSRLREVMAQNHGQLIPPAQITQQAF